MYLRAQREFQPTPPGFADELPWQRFVQLEPAILSTEDDGLLTTFAMEPFDLGSFSKRDQGLLMLRANEASILEPGWALWTHARHLPVVDYAETPWSNPVAAELDAEWREKMTQAEARFRTCTYLSVWQRPPSSQASFLNRFFLTGVADETAADKILHDYQAAISRFEALFEPCCRTLTRLDGPGMLRYLNPFVSVYDFDDIPVPSTPVNISAYLNDSGFLTGIRPVLGPTDEQGRPINGGVYVRCLTMSRRWPQTLRPAVSRELRALPFAFEETVRWITESREQAEHRTTKRQFNWMSSKKGVRAQIYEILTQDKASMKNTYIDRLADDADLSLDRMLSGLEAHGYITYTWTVKHADLRVADAQLNRILAILHRHGLKAYDATVDAVEVYLATMPGNVYANCEKHEMTTTNLAAIMPLHAPWPGIAWNEHLDRPPLTIAIADGCNHYGLDPWVGDLPDGQMYGPKGSGKSTLLNWWASQGLKTETDRYLGLDTGKSSEAITRCLGGEFHDLGLGECGIQILAHLRTGGPHELVWLASWFMNRVQEAYVGQPMPFDVAKAEQYITTALMSLRASRAPLELESLLVEMAAHQRETELASNSKIDAQGMARRDPRYDTRVDLYATVQGIIKLFKRGNIYGHFVDAAHETLTIGRIHTFELEKLAKIPRVYSAVIEAVWHRMTQTFTGAPTRIHVDEAWEVINPKNTVFLEILRTGLPAWRKLNVGIMFATQSISQIDGHPLTGLIQESAQFKVYLPNWQALDAKVFKYYEDLQLNYEEVQRNLVLVPRRGVAYVCRPDGRRLIDVTLEPLARYLCGSNTQEAHAVMDELLSTYDPAEFPWRYVERGGFPEASRRIRQALDRGHPEQIAAVLAS